MGDKLALSYGTAEDRQNAKEIIEKGVNELKSEKDKLDLAFSDKISKMQEQSSTRMDRLRLKEERLKEIENLKAQAKEKESEYIA